MNVSRKNLSKMRKIICKQRWSQKEEISETTHGTSKIGTLEHFFVLFLLFLCFVHKETLFQLQKQWDLVPSHLTNNLVDTRSAASVGYVSSQQNPQCSIHHGSCVEVFRENICAFWCNLDLCHSDPDMADIVEDSGFDSDQKNMNGTEQDSPQPVSRPRCCMQQIRLRPSHKDLE